MSNFTCSNTDCTIAVTGKCLLSHSPIEACPNAQVSPTISEKELKPTGSAVATTSLFHGNELGSNQASALLSARYGHLIGVLGAYGAGKTCLLSSLYLLAGCGDLRPQYLFAGSATLPGFENRLRLLRKWDKSVLPDKIVDHTILADPRQPGFLHLALLQTVPAPTLRDLYFSDIPGEWTTDLIKRAAVAERFRFLHRADGLVIAVPATELLDIDTRNPQIQSARILFQRLRDAVGIDPEIPVVIAITRCDKTGISVPPSIYGIVEYARELGFSNVSHMPIAAFSDRQDVPSGTGVASILEALLHKTPQSPLSRSAFTGSRMFSRYSFGLETMQ